MEHALLVHAFLLLARLSQVFQGTHGTPSPGTHVLPERLAWAIGALAEGQGIRAVARVFEVPPLRSWRGLIEVADHAAVFCPHCLHDVRVTQVPLDELFALLRAVKADEVGDMQPPSD
jgi:hypothetical protein